MVSASHEFGTHSFKKDILTIQYFNRMRDTMINILQIDEGCTKRFSYSLVPETNPEYGDGFVKMPNDVFRDSRVGRRTRARRNDNARGFQALDFLGRNLIVSEYAKVFPKLAQILNEVVRK